METIQTKEVTRIGAGVSAQIARMGEITFTDGEFRIPNNVPFQIKNDGEEAVTLEVLLDQMWEGNFIETSFAPGWNPEIVRAVKEPEGTVDLKYGY